MIRNGKKFLHWLKFLALVFLFISCKPRQFNDQQQTAKANSTLELGAQNDENPAYEWKLNAISASQSDDPLAVEEDGHFWFELVDVRYSLQKKHTLSFFQNGINVGTDNRYYNNPKLHYAMRSFFLTAKDYEKFKESLKNFKWSRPILNGQQAIKEAMNYSARNNCSSFGAQIWDTLTGEKLYHPRGHEKYSSPVFFRTKLIELNGGRSTGFVEQKLPPNSLMERAAEVDSIGTTRKDIVYENRLCYGVQAGQICRKWLSPDGKGAQFGGTSKEFDMIFKANPTGLPIDRGTFEINADYPDFKSLRIVLRYSEATPPGTEPNWSEPLVIADQGELKGSGPAKKIFALKPIAFRQVGASADSGIWKVTIESKDESLKGLALSASLTLAHVAVQIGQTVLP